MPLYEFSCRKCGEEFERILPPGTEKTACPACRSRKVERKFSLFGMKSGGRFTSSSGSDCSSCKSSSCKSCKG